MQRYLASLFLMFLAFTADPLLAAGDPRDYQGSSDPALFSRMPGFYISNYEALDFNRHEFMVGHDRKQSVEGRQLYLDYYVKDGVKVPSGLQVVRNYTNAAKAIGGKVVYAYEDGGTQYATLKVAQKNAEVWAAIEAANNGMYKLWIIEKQAMNQEVVADASSLAGSIKETGKAAVYGIYFDSDKAEIKPESEAAMEEIAKLLKADADLKLYVVGHTDNVGGFVHNLKLSNSRAAAVVKALVGKHGIAQARLTPYGDGPTAPVAANTTEEGRAKNRRVELVAQ